MRLLRASYQAFCQFKDRAVEFHPGLNCICGPNGSGKSNTLYGIAGALTGTFRAEGTKTSNINFLADKKATSGVEVLFEHNGEEVSIYRGLRPSKQVLKIGDATYDKDGEIREALQGLLGIDDKVLLEYVFVDQWKMFSFLSSGAATRMKMLQNLFGAQQAELIYSVLGKASVPQVYSQDNLDALKQQQQQVFQTLQQVIAREKDYAEIASDWDVTKDERYLELEGVRANKANQDASAKFRKEAEQLTDRLRSYSGEIARNQQNLVALNEKAKSFAMSADDAKSMLFAWESYERNHANRASLVARLKAAEEQSFVEPDKPENYIPENATQELNELNARATTLVSFLKTFRESGVPNCPTCGTPTESLADRIDEYTREYGLLYEQISKINAGYTASRAYDRAKIVFEQNVAGKLQTVANLREALANITEEVPPSTPKPDCQQLLQQWAEWQRETEEVQRKLVSLEHHTQTCQARLTQVNQELSQLPVSEPVDDGYIQRLEQELGAKSQRFREKLELAARRRELEANLQAIEARIQQAEEVVVLQGRQKALSTHLDSVRQVFHHNQLPQAVVSQRLGEMQDTINDLLSDLESPFRVTVDSDCNFVAKFHDGRVQPVERLSGGEKVVFSLAFRIVINAIFASHIGLLCLDEPTAGLDEKNLGCLEIALRRLRDLSKTSGLQVILITHERLLENLFDNVIDLSRPQFVTSY